jgi:hypothetical protein
LRSFQIIILQTFLIAIIINNNIGKYLLIRKKNKKRKKLRIFGQGVITQYFQNIISIAKGEITLNLLDKNYEKG